jgi:hypothetical protein
LFANEEESIYGRSKEKLKPDRQPMKLPTLEFAHAVRDGGIIVSEALNQALTSALNSRLASEIEI